MRGTMLITMALACILHAGLGRAAVDELFSPPKKPSTLSAVQERLDNTSLKPARQHISPYTNCQLWIRDWLGTQQLQHYLDAQAHPRKGHLKLSYFLDSRESILNAKSALMLHEENYVAAIDSDQETYQTNIRTLSIIKESLLRQRQKDDPLSLLQAIEKFSPKDLPSSLQEFVDKAKPVTVEIGDHANPSVTMSTLKDFFANGLFLLLIIYALSACISFPFAFLARKLRKKNISHH